MVLTEGFDCPPLSCGIIARPTRNLGLFIQMGGRILRTDEASGKEDAYLIDHSGNLYEHGFLEDDHGWQLNEGEACIPAEERQKNLDEKKPITCMNCSHVYTGQLPCPKCGHIPERKGEWVETRHADLIEIRSNKRAKDQEKTKVTKVWTSEEKQLWYSYFTHYAQEKGHKDGSIAHKYKDKFGVWPKNMIKDPIPPTAEAQAYIQHLNIKASYRRRAQQRAQ